MQSQKNALRWISFCSLLLLIIIIVYIALDKNFFVPSFTSARSIRQRVCSLNNIDVCQAYGPGTNGTFVYVMGGSAGFGSELNNMLLALAYSAKQGRQFFIDDQRWRYGSFHDYFNINTKHYNQSYKHQILTKSFTRNQQFTHLKFIRSFVNLRTLWSTTKDVQNIPAKRKAGHYLWKNMKNNLFTVVQSCKPKNYSRYIGIHVRRGDKGAEQNVIPISKYIKSLEQQFKKDETLPIFVASDDRNMVQQLQKAQSEWTFFGLNMKTVGNTGKSGHSQTVFNRLPEELRRIELQYLVCEIQMLIDAEMVFCGMLSNICRLVQILREQPIETLISLDRPWFTTL